MAAKPDGKTADESAAAAKSASAAASGLKPWLPLLANLVLMPVMGYLTVNFFLLPKSHQSAAAEAKADAGEKGKPEGESKGTAVRAERTLVPLANKIIVNVQNTQGTRYLLASITLEGTTSNFKEIVDKSDAELRDAANSVLMGKTIADIDKPGAKNQIRAELLTVFNNILGAGSVKQVFLTEFAMQ